MITIRLLTQTSTTPVAAGFASAYGASLIGPTCLHMHQGYAYYDSVEIELLACLQTLKRCEQEGWLHHDPHVSFVSDDNALEKHILQLQKGSFHSAVQEIIWGHLQDFDYLEIDFSDDLSSLTTEIESVVRDELLEGLLQGMTHLDQTNHKVSIFCSRASNTNTILFAQRVIETAQSDNLRLYLHETSGTLFGKLLEQAIHQQVDYYIVGCEPDCHAATYIYADNPTLWLAQQTSRAYGITPTSARDKTGIASAMSLFEQRHKIARLLVFEP